MAKKEKSEAAEKIVKAEKTRAKKPKSDKPNIFVRMGKAIARYWKDFRGELKKIVWPDLKMILKSSGIVIASIAIFLFFVWLIDLGLSKSIELLSDAARGADTEISEAVDETTTTATTLNNIIEDTTADGGEETEEDESATEAVATTAAATGAAD